MSALYHSTYYERTVPQHILWAHYITPHTMSTLYHTTYYERTISHHIAWVSISAHLFTRYWITTYITDPFQHLHQSAILSIQHGGKKLSQVNYVIDSIHLVMKYYMIKWYLLRLSNLIPEHSFLSSSSFFHFHYDGFIFYNTILYYAILYYTILYYTILYYTILYYTILYYTILYYTILYYSIV